MRTLGIARWKPDRGSTIFEFSLVAFMFIIVLLGVVEMCRMVLVYTTLANAARAGARYAIVHGANRTGSGVDGPSGPGSVTQVQTVVTNFAKAGLLDTTKLTVTVAYPNSNNNAGSPVSVTTSYPYDPLVTYFNSILGTTMGSKSQGVITF
jgi:Flp pilus assembly protein TadG